MRSSTAVRFLFASVMLPLLPSMLHAQEVTTDTPITSALQELGADVSTYNDHIVTLASPFMDGRLPGTNGMEVAKDYVQYWMEDAGLEPAFRLENGSMSFRQAFPLGSSEEVVTAQLNLASGAAQLQAGKDFQLLGLGGSGDLTAPVTFIGYSIDAGENGYTSFLPQQDLSGRIALMLRFEPMDENGKSLWAKGSPWSSHSSFSGKVRSAAAKNPAAIIIVNTPGADDPRVSEMMAVGSGGAKRTDVPVFQLSGPAATQLLKLGSAGASLMELRRHADDGGAPLELDLELKIQAEIDRTPLIAENVGGLLPGKGALADELLVIGAHLDHLGMGDFGSRSGAGELHPGADDNASGSAAVIMLAEKLNASYADLPDGASARSILFLCFSGEESGLNGSRYYVREPIVPIENHAMMINFDMIGRIVNRRLSISGADTSPGLRQLLEELATQSDLNVVLPKQISGASDHTPFYRKKMPILFGAIADFHQDYHTPRDTSSKINRVDAVRTVELFHQIGLAVATQKAAWEYVDPTQDNTSSKSAGLGAIKVRFGVAPGNYDSEDPGILVASVTPGGSADKAGILADDLMLRWDGVKILDVREWMGMMAKHKPGDVVKVGIMRGGKEITIDVTLQARDTGGN
ncbi:MAG: M28 family peptidase [Planctomycetes bacterium]|nr:M28 family peptidase [Planctomycetota bacterium]